jgi:hypothetical protein
MGTLPKFLLPTFDHPNHNESNSRITTLLHKHIKYGLDFSDLVILATRPENAFLMKSYLVPNKVELLVLETNSMAETVMRVAKVCEAEENLVLMPDSHFSKGFNTSEMVLRKSEAASLGIWRILPEQIGSVGQIEFANDSEGQLIVSNHVDKDPTSKFEYLWGAMNISALGISMLTESMPHVGYLISKLLQQNNPNSKVGVRLQSGDYIDCGSPLGYFSHLER